MDNIDITNKTTDIIDTNNTVEPEKPRKATNFKWLSLFLGLVFFITLGFFTYKFLIFDKTKKLVNMGKNKEIIENLDEASNSQNAFGTLLSQSNSTETTKPSTTETTVKNQPDITVNKETPIIEEKVSEPEKAIPENNDKPSIKLTSWGYKDRTFSEDDPINLSLTAEDNIGGISYVEFYINGEKEKTVQYRALYDKDTEGWDPGEGDRGINIASDYLEDKYDDNDIGYTYRHYKKFDTTKSSCGFSEGYIFIMAGDKYLYDVRMKKGLEEVKVCYKGDSINYNDNYIYLFRSDDGDYEFYAKAYDKYGTSAKSEKIEFEID
ncbi:MAG TPA: Ig-like domain-containing protein [bacterium]|nr:Ig-like domain-containing protein [bacterium]